MLTEVALLVAGFVLGALHQRYVMTKLVRHYAKRPYARKIARTIVMEEWVATVKDPTMRPLLQELLDAAERNQP